MSDGFSLPTVESARDLLSFIQRARRVNDGAARLIVADGFLQAYVGVLFPRGLLDRTPTVLGLRVFRVMDHPQFDVVVPLESLAFRIERALDAHNDGPVEVVTPAQSPSIQWAAVTPPRDGWHRRVGVSSAQLTEAAQAGVAQVAQSLPDAAGEAVVQKVRAEVWGQPLGKKKSIPWAAGFAADALGFVDGRNLAVHSVDNWIRLTSKNGYVLVKTPGEPEGLDNE
jgi:hypothetical protein